MPLVKQKQQRPKKKKEALDRFKTRPVNDCPEFMWREPRKSVPNIVAIHPSDARNSGAEITTSCWLLKVKPLVTSPGKLTKKVLPPPTLGSIRQVHVGTFSLHQLNSDPENDSSTSLQQRPKPIHKEMSEHPSSQGDHSFGVCRGEGRVGWGGGG